MSRSGLEVRRGVESRVPGTGNAKEKEMRSRARIGAPGGVWLTWVLRVALACGLGALGYGLGAFGLSGWAAAGVGLVAAGLIVTMGLQLEKMPAGGLVGGAVGVVAGLVCALLVVLVVSEVGVSEGARLLTGFFCLLAFAYLGLVLGAKSGLELSQRIEPSGTGESVSSSLKLVDTSVLIDGRIADICEAHFLDGTIGIPQFVLRELQMVADSSDTLKRQRGRRGLEVLQRMQKMTQVAVEI